MAGNFIDHSADFKTKMRQGAVMGLEACGHQAVSHAKNEITAQVPRNGGASWYTLTGDLKKGISNKVVDPELTVYIGTNLEYAKYNEYGTGIYAEGGGGKQGFWVFVPGSSSGGVGGAKAYTEAEAKRIVAILQSKGIDAHMTNGMKPIHFLKNAVEKNAKEYHAILIKYIQKAFH